MLGGVVNPVKGQGGIGGVGGIAQFWGLEGEGVHAEALEDAAVIVSRSVPRIGLFRSLAPAWTISLGAWKRCGEEVK